MHTVLEAKKLWCPMVRACVSEEDGNASNCGANEQYRNPVYARCIAEACAAWQDCGPHHESEAIRQGYCGLAKR